jgi:cold shock protein
MHTGTVKWFNATKGFGFITPDGGGSDIFVHITAVQQSGLSNLEKLQRVRYGTGRNGKGPCAENLTDLGFADDNPVGERLGRVKWFDPTKGFGFIEPIEGGTDVFVHISALNRAGMDTLREGEQLRYTIDTSGRKPSAANLRRP